MRVFNRFNSVALAFALSTGAAQAASFDLNGLLGNAAGFAVLGMEQGDVTINSATSITGDVGYTDGVVSNTNQKVDQFDGTAYLHSGASVNTTPATFAPTGGVQSGAQVDAYLNQANQDALNAAQFLSTVNAGNVGTGITFAEFNLGALGDNDSRVISTNGSSGADIDAGNVDFVRLNVDSLGYKDDALTLVGDSSDIFLFNVAGNFDFAGSRVELEGISWENVIFNFASGSEVMINKASTLFNGRILGPDATIEYHNPAGFNGAILAKSIDLHSDFNLSGPSKAAVAAPAPASLLLSMLAILGLGARRLKSL